MDRNHQPESLQPESHQDEKAANRLGLHGEANHRLFHLPEVDSRGLLADVDRSSELECVKIDDVDRSRLSSNALDGNEGETAVGTDGHSVGNPATRGDAGQLLPRVDIPNGG